jgi:hypothetical protein
MTSQLALNLADLQRDWINDNAPVVLSKMRGKEFTADDLHDVLPYPQERNWFGVLMARLANRGLIQRTGYRASQRPARNGGIVSVWVTK